ncbi:cache domain-containing protein [Desulfobacterales bacterium HSG17]|nr:cache domain-containing protein [Desulfobacterales bacterium HSG17]
MFANLKIKTKLLLAILAIGFIPFIFAVLYSFNISSQALSSQAFSQLESIREIKKDQITNFFEERRKNMNVLTETVSTLRQAAIEKIITVQEIKKAQVEEYFQNCISDIKVISKNILINEALNNFSATFENDGTYDKALFRYFEEMKYKNSLIQYKAEYGYYDLLLINKQGRIVYSINKESDLGQDLINSELKNTGLGICFQKGLKHVNIQDFENFSPSEDKYIAFIGSPIKENDETIGVLVFKLSKDPINKIIQRHNGMGKTGETYIAGRWNDKISYRSDRLIRPGKTGEFKSDKEIEFALNGETGSIIRIGSTNKVDIAGYAPINIPGLSWTMITVMSLEEAISPRLKGEATDYFSKYVRQYGYHDLLLIHPKGQVFYSVEHHSDYGSNLINGDYAGSNLALLFQDVMKTGKFGFADFAPYFPSDNKPSAFIAQPVIFEGNIELVAALQIPIEVINDFMKERSGMGASGESYLVGHDRLMRSDSFSDPENYSVENSFVKKSRVTTKSSQKALEQSEAGQDIITNYTGTKVLSAYTSLKIWDKTWALIAEIDESEAFAPVNNLKATMLIVGLIAFAGIIVFALWVTGFIMKPIVQIAENIKKVSEGRLFESLDFEFSRMNQKDEIGMIISAVYEMQARIRDVLMETDNLIRSAQKGSLNIRGNAEAYKGGWQELIIGINNLIDAFMSPITMTAEIISRIARGDIPEKISAECRGCQGEFGEIRKNLNLLIDSMNEISVLAEAVADGNLNIALKKRSEKDRLMEALGAMTDVLNKTLKETRRLIHGIQQGQLDIKGREEDFLGGWQELIMGFNRLIEAFTTPINVTATYIDRISKGDIPEKINEEYRGDFNEIKNNINRLINVTNGVTEIAQEISQGNLSVMADRRSEKDAMMEAFENMINYLQDVADITEKVSNNEPNVKVAPKSDKDVLNRSLQKMIKNLRNMMDDIQANMNIVKQQNWLKTGLAELGNTMRGGQDVSTLAQNIISFLADYLNAQIGTIYLEKEKNIFFLAGSYACEQSQGVPKIIEAGEGLAGQVALEKKSILFSDVPKNYLNIYSGMGRSAPKNILVFPLIYEQQVKGVAELGTFDNFSEIETDFLNQAAGNIAIAFDAAQTREKMRKLLEESRQQAEELRMQQAELQAVNKEHEMQTDILTESETALY